MGSEKFTHPYRIILLLYSVAGCTANATDTLAGLIRELGCIKWRQSIMHRKISRSPVWPSPLWEECGVGLL